MDEENVRHMCQGMLLSHKKEEILPRVTTRMDLKGIMLTERSQRKTHTVHSPVESKTSKQRANLQKKKPYFLQLTRGETWEVEKLKESSQRVQTSIIR